MKVSNFPETLHAIFIKFTSHSTPKGAPACAMTSKLYTWDPRKRAQNDQKTAIFGLFSIFSKIVHAIQTIFFTFIVYHVRVLCVPRHQNRMTVI